MIKFFSSYFIFSFLNITGRQGLEPSSIVLETIMLPIAPPTYIRCTQDSNLQTISGQRFSRPLPHHPDMQHTLVTGLEPIHHSKMDSSDQQSAVLPIRHYTSILTKIKINWAKQIRTVVMQESKSCALPLGDSPIILKWAELDSNQRRPRSADLQSAAIATMRSTLI